MEGIGIDGFRAGGLYLRNYLCKKYSFAIPSRSSIKLIAQYGPIIDIGAGTGYWAKMLHDYGVDIVAYDKDADLPFEARHYSKAKWFDVELGHEDAIDEHSDRTLLMVWPEHEKPMAYNCAMKLKPGQHMIFVGECSGGCTGDEAFFELLGHLPFSDCMEEEDTENPVALFDVVHQLDIPKWWGVHDYLTIYRRK